MNIRQITTCTDCSEIIVQGYTDNISDWQEHKERVLQVERVLKPGEYFLDQTKTDKNEFFASCDCCSVKGAQHTNYISKHI